MGNVIPTFEGHIVDKKVKMLNREEDRMKEYVRSFKNDDKILITIKKFRATRSYLQNNYYWGVVLELLSEHIGDTPEGIHEDMKLEFNPRVSPTTGKTTGGSTRTLNTQEFKDYLKRIQYWAATFHNLNIPDPQKGERE